MNDSVTKSVFYFQVTESHVSSYIGLTNAKVQLGKSHGPEQLLKGTVAHAFPTKWQFF